MLRNRMSHSAWGFVSIMCFDNSSYLHFTFPVFISQFISKYCTQNSDSGEQTWFLASVGEDKHILAQLVLSHINAQFHLYSSFSLILQASMMCDKVRKLYSIENFSWTLNGASNMLPQNILRNIPIDNFKNNE